MNAIIFLAAISCFDQVLAEEPSVNRIVCSLHSYFIVILDPHSDSPFCTGGFSTPLEVRRLTAAAEENESRAIS